MNKHEIRTRIQSSRRLIGRSSSSATWATEIVDLAQLKIQV
jgi:hypothetical protein